jgi:hypothetical protein
VRQVNMKLSLSLAFLPELATPSFEIWSALECHTMKRRLLPVFFLVASIVAMFGWLYFLACSRGKQSAQCSLSE